MKKILDLREYVNDRLRTDERGARLSIPEFNRMAWLAQGIYYDDLIRAYESTLELTNVLNKFIVVDLKSIAGTLAFPADYYKTTSLERLDDGIYRRCDISTLKEWGARLKDSTAYPSDIDPMARIISNQIEVLPAVGNVKHYYFRKLVNPEIKFTITNDEVSLDDANSIDLEFQDNASFERIANIILTKVGISTNDPNLAQAAAQNI